MQAGYHATTVALRSDRNFVKSKVLEMVRAFGAAKSSNPWHPWHQRPTSPSRQLIMNDKRSNQSTGTLNRMQSSLLLRSFPRNIRRRYLPEETTSIVTTKGGRTVPSSQHGLGKYSLYYRRNVASL